MIKKKGDKYVVTDSSGKKVLGEHESREKALSQLRAIEMSKHNIPFTKLRNKLKKK